MGALSNYNTASGIKNKPLENSLRFDVCHWCFSIVFSGKGVGCYLFGVNGSNTIVVLGT